jgi:hypothetical protein
LARLGPGDDELLHHGQTYLWSCQRVSITTYLTVRDDKDEFVAVWIVGGGDRVECGPQAGFGFGVRSNKANHVGQREAERFVIGRRLGNDVDEGERAVAVPEAPRSGSEVELLDDISGEIILLDPLPPSEP